MSDKATGVRRASPLGLGLLLLATGLAACGGPDPAAEPALSSARPATTAVASTRQAATMANGEVCVGSVAHDSHAFPAGCVLCHACGGVYGFTELTLPRGTSTAGGTITRGSTTSTCLVACHDQDGVLNNPIAWNATGPLACSSCHTDVAPDPANIRSVHAVIVPGDPAAERAACEGCHQLTAHTGGLVRIADGEGGYIDILPGATSQLIGACRSCHDGDGTAIGARTPPLLAGWDDADWHGPLAGTGSGGTLKSPFVRGQPALACTECHASHASTNEFMVASTVNGLPIPAGVIDRAGVGAQLLCESCHEGNRHQYCIDCHGNDPMPAGSPCFACHGHEGIQTWPYIAPRHADLRYSPDGCIHCHSPGWMPALEYIPPVITSGGLVNVTNITGTSATVVWNTDEKASSFVEWGLAGGPLGKVAGQTEYVNSHAVTISGLTAATRYDFRVRTSDRLRNVRLSAVKTFQTVNPNAPAAPTLVPEPDLFSCDGSFAPVTLQWNAVTSPTGGAVDYRVQLDDSPAFDSPIADSGWTTARSYATSVPVTWYTVNYYWRVVARDAASGAMGPYSQADVFGATDMSWDTSWCF